MFEFYLSSCELGFRCGRLMVFQIQLTHRQTAVPLTRDYITVSIAALPNRPKRAGLRRNG
jgi:cyclopropane-fatty-acyl-phospholipid synthase